MLVHTNFVGQIDKHHFQGPEVLFIEKELYILLVQNDVCFKRFYRK